MPAGDLLVSLRGVTKDYHGLRPLRVERLDLREGESVAIVGLDRAGAEVLVDLITAASLPDSGEIEIFGNSTRSISGSGWFQALDHFGIVSERAVLLEALTVEQNLALPLSLELNELPLSVRQRVEEIAATVAIPPMEVSQPLARLEALGRFKVRLGRALALKPRILLAEHPNASVRADEVPHVAAQLARLFKEANLTGLVLTADPIFASAVAKHVLILDPKTGNLKGSAVWRRWLG